VCGLGVIAVWSVENEIKDFVYGFCFAKHRSCNNIKKVMGFQRVCAPFGGVFRGNAPESLSAESEMPYRSKTEKEVRKPIGFRGEADTTASPCMIYCCVSLKNVPVAHF